MSIGVDAPLKNLLYQMATSDVVTPRTLTCRSIRERGQCSVFEIIILLLKQTLVRIEMTCALPWQEMKAAGRRKIGTKMCERRRKIPIVSDEGKCQRFLGR